MATRTHGHATANDAAAVPPHDAGEGTITKMIEQYTTQVPSGVFLSLAVGSIGVAALLKLSGRKDDAQFVGQLVPTILLLGLYNKLVKIQGSE